MVRLAIEDRERTADLHAPGVRIHFDDVHIRRNGAVATGQEVGIHRTGHKGVRGTNLLNGKNGNRQQWNQRSAEPGHSLNCWDHRVSHFIEKACHSTIRNGTKKQYASADPVACPNPKDIPPTVYRF